MKEYQVYLFDMDGTLVNSEPLKGLALSLACRDYGSEVDFTLYKDVMGESWARVTAHFFRNAHIAPDLAEFDRHFRTHYERLLSQKLSLNIGAKEYIEQLHAAGKKCGVVSSAATWMVEHILEALNLKGLFDIVITQEHVTRHKPDPEAYELALQQLNIDPANVLIFEDSSAGVEAGVSSGCDVVAIAHKFNGKNDLSKAVRVIENYEEMFTQQTDRS
ncbi:MAG: HAD family phosphatase [Desulfobulbus sp.]|nr:HAD family phosphatase [Desulfobulbus sp.]